MVKETSAFDSMLSEFERTKKEALNLKINYPQNKFVNRSIELLDKFIQQALARGVFEFSILNENGIINDVVFYQIKNIGFYL